MGMEIRGNITVNIFEGNSNLTIINEKVVNEDSFNNSTVIEKRLRSKNLSSGKNTIANNNRKDYRRERNENKFVQKKRIFGGSTYDQFYLGKKKKEEENEKSNNENKKLDSKEWIKHKQLRFRGRDDFEPNPTNPELQLRKRKILSRHAHI